MSWLWLLLLLAVLVARFMLAGKRFPALESSRPLAVFTIVAGVAFIAFEWIRDRSLAAWQPGHAEILALIVTPALCLASLQRILRGPTTLEEPEGSGWKSPVTLVGLFIGVVNAWGLGVWRRVSPELLRSPGVWVVVVGAGLVGGLFIIADRRADARRSVDE